MKINKISTKVLHYLSLFYMKIGKTCTHLLMDSALQLRRSQKSLGSRSNVLVCYLHFPTTIVMTIQLQNEMSRIHNMTQQLHI